MLQLGQHERELNPYWKDGGKGLPEQEVKKHLKEASCKPVAGDGGVSWLRKALQRCHEIAEVEGCTAEDVAAERYGVSVKLSLPHEREEQ